MEELEPRSPGCLLQELKQFTEQCRSRLTEMMQGLGWEQQTPSGEQEITVCPYDTNHRMPLSSLEKHVVVCRRRKLGYTKEEADVYDTQFFYQKANITSIILDKNKQFQVIQDAKNNAPSLSEDGSWSKREYTSSSVEVPLNHKRAICELTSADRLAIYNYVLQESKKQRSEAEKIESDLFEDLTSKINQDDEQKCPKSHLEIMAEMRDYKRRRQSYRAKNVHITKKSYTEVIRDVINLHMEELSGKWHDEMHDEMHDEANSSISSSSVKRKEQPRSPSVESRQSERSHRDRHRSGRRRQERSRSPYRHRSSDREKDSRRKKDRDNERHHKRRKDD